MALRTSAPYGARRSIRHAIERRPAHPTPEAEGDPLSAARGILYGVIGGAAVWAAAIGGAVAMIQRLR
jgi:hypothetical protein